jgi:hypothetical protein
MHPADLHIMKMNSEKLMLLEEKLGMQEFKALMELAI